MLTVCASSTDLDLTTTGFVNQLMGRSATSTQDQARLSALIRAASRWAESFVSYPIAGAQTYQETVASYDRNVLMLARTPVRALDRLFDSTDTGLGAQIRTSEVRVEDREAGLLSMVNEATFDWTARLMAPPYYHAGWPLTLNPLPGQERRPWLADYRAGWTYDGLSTGSANWSTENGTTSTGRTLPEDVELAVAMKVMHDYQNPLNVIQESLGDISVEYRPRSGSAADVPPWENLLGPYVRSA